MNKKIKLLVMDVDGTLTDGKIYMSTQGELFKAFNSKDGCGIHDLLPKAEIIPVIITARESDILTNRCKELNISFCYQGCRDKVAKLQEVAAFFNIVPNQKGIYTEIAYIGDDIPDIPCMCKCGLIGCPSDAVKEVKNIANYVSFNKGGEGAVREFIEWLLTQ